MVDMSLAVSTENIPADLGELLERHPMKTTNPNRDRARKIVRELNRLYSDARIALDFETPFQLLIATILSAQCTDTCVNRVSPILFRAYPDPTPLAAADRKKVETIIRPTGFFRNKAKNIIACSRTLLEQYGGEVPSSMEELVRLPGVARKTANVVLGHAFAIPGIPVDTHVGRLSLRLGLTEHENPVKVEQDLNALIPKKDWTRFGLQLIFHGRQVCRSQIAACSRCTLSTLCPKNGVTRSR